MDATLSTSGRKPAKKKSQDAMFFVKPLAMFFDQRLLPRDHYVCRAVSIS